jgi:hypothetical protein
MLEEKKKVSKIIIVWFIIAILLMSLGGIYMIMNNDTVSNPETCKTPFNTTTDSTVAKWLIQKIYNSPNCYDYNLINGNYTIFCCHDKGVKYPHEKVLN